jgi:2-polyprenyl-6-methoxyphenol hydroxylase-like FAD-dependent oxidoreductase
VILVVGAGPVGLTLALALSRQGAAVRLIDKLAAPSELSKAIAIHARTLEVCADLGVADALLAEGQAIHAINFYGDGHPITRLSLDPIDSPFPLVLDLAQDRTEAILAAALPVPVERGVALTSFRDHGTHVQVSLDNGETFDVDYLVGCDGAHSTVRKGLGLPFEGAPYEYDWVLADVELAGEHLARDEMHMCLHPDGLLACFPLGPTRVRFVADRGGGTGDPTVADFQAMIDRRGLAPARITEAHWLTAFKLHHRMVPRHSVGRVFLCGDAAHIHSPAGGQGMNTGMQDAYNLAWKLALGAGLESYTAERNPVAAQLLAGTDAMTRAATLRNPFTRAVRDHLLGFFLGIGAVQARVLDNVAELAVHYPDSPLNGAGKGRPGPGDRAPDAPLADGSIHVLLRGGKHTLLVFDAEAPEVDLKVVTVEDAEARARYHARPGEAFLVRPDGYVAFRVPVSRVAEEWAAYQRRLRG